MIDVRTLLLSTVVFAFSIHPGEAGPCTAAIDQLQARLDAQLEATAAAGPAGKESLAAKLHHQPTPGSIAAAEQRLGEGAGLNKALAALQRARALDQADDRPACQQAVEEARRALGG